MESKTYIFKKYLGKSKYREFEEELVEKELSLLNEKLNISQEIDSFKFSKIALPEESLDNLNDLLKTFSLGNYADTFLWLIGTSQYHYLLYIEENNHDLFSDYNNERDDLEMLFKALRYYLFGNRKDLGPISFRNKGKDSVIIKNFFVIDDLYKGIIYNYGLNKSNFDERKRKILETSNRFKYNKGGEHIKRKIVGAVFDFIQAKNKTIGKNEALKFCGVFLHICQIPSNNEEDDVLVGEIGDSLAAIDYINVGHYLDPRSSYYL